MLVLNTLAPVFLLIAIGAGLQRSGFVSAGFLKEANRVTYWLGLPALVFSELADSFHHAAGGKWMLLATAAATALAIVVAYGAALALRVPGAAMGTFVQGAVRGNLAFVGLPVIFAMPDTVLAGGVSARAAAIVVVGPMMVANNVVGVVVLLLSQHRLGWAMVRPFLRQLVTTPPLVATLAGIGFALAGWTLPAWVDKALGALGEMALPLGLLAVGGSLVVAKWSTLGRAAWGAALLKTAVGPALGWVAARALGLGATETKMVMVFMATPTAVVSYVMAMELKGDESLASGSIVLSVVTSIVALAVVLGFF
ncbi:MAG TPA: AEC family transporter [Opitutus sp.]|nr:AEC family transporter [Opitutus sp.]